MGYLINSYLSSHHEGCLDWQREFRKKMMVMYAPKKSPISIFLCIRNIWYACYELCNFRYKTNFLSLNGDSFSNSDFDSDSYYESESDSELEYVSVDFIYQPKNIEILGFINEYDRIFCSYYLGPGGSYGNGGFCIYCDGTTIEPRRKDKVLFNHELFMSKYHFDFFQIKAILCGNIS